MKKGGSVFEGARNELDDELAALGSARGRDSEIRLRRVLAEVVRWVCTIGHGDIKLSVLGHLVSLKVRIDSVVTVRGEPRK